MRNKKILIIFSVLILAVVIALILLNSKYSLVGRLGLQEEVFEPEFLSVSEKQELGIPDNEIIQVLLRNANNEVAVYRVLDSEDEAVNPQDIGPISPRAINRE